MKMKPFLSIIAALVFSVSAVAQNVDNQFRITYRGSAGLEYSLNADDEQLSIFVVHGAQLTPKLFAGAGIGFPFMADIADEEPRHWVVSHHYDDSSNYYYDYYEKEPGIYERRNHYYNDEVSYYEKEHGTMGGQVFLDLKYHFYDKNITPFIETTYGAGRKFCGDNFINCSVALGIKISQPALLSFMIYTTKISLFIFGGCASRHLGEKTCLSTGNPIYKPVLK